MRTDEVRAAIERLRDDNRQWLELNEDPAPGDMWVARVHPDVEADLSILLAEVERMAVSNGEANVAVTETHCRPNGFGMCDAHHSCEHVRDSMREVWRKHDALKKEVDRLRLYERACESMAAQFICPKMTAEELAKTQVGEK